MDETGTRRYVVVGTAGHIDHGKSALVEALTGTDPDRLKEEKSRGITIDLGFAHLDAGETQLAFVDVPGHERFVKNMLAGASGIDGVLLVVAADESVMPQTREHFDICRLLDVKRGVVALTKADLVDAETLALVRLETEELLLGSFLDKAPMVAVSSKTGEGVSDVRRALVGMAAQASWRETAGFVRLPIDRSFSVKGFGTVVTGTLVSGRVTVDSTLRLLPAGRDIKIRGLQVHGEPRKLAVSGQRVAANLSGVEVSEVARGDTVVSPGRFETTRRLDVSLHLLPSARRLRHGARVRFHQGTSEVLGRVALGPIVGDSSVTVDAPSELQSNGRAFARIRLEAPAILTRGDRFILRAYSPPLTIAGGYVIDPQPPSGGLRTAAGRARLLQLQVGATSDDRTGQEQAVQLLVEERGLTGLSICELYTRWGLGQETAEALVARMEALGALRRIGELLVATGALAEVGERLVSMVTAFHAQDPLSEGVPREELRERLFRRAGAAVFDAVLDRLVDDDRLVARDRVARAGHEVVLSPEERRVSDAALTLLRDAGLSPPAPAAVAARLDCDPAVLDRVLLLLVRRRELTRVGTLVFDRHALERLAAEVRTLNTGAEPTRLDVATFKDRYEISRKFAIPLLEYLDRERVTRRVGQQRIVL